MVNKAKISAPTELEFNGRRETINIMFCMISWKVINAVEKRKKPSRVQSIKSAECVCVCVCVCVFK